MLEKSKTIHNHPSNHDRQRYPPLFTSPLSDTDLPFAAESASLLILPISWLGFLVIQKMKLEIVGSGAHIKSSKVNTTPVTCNTRIIRAHENLKHSKTNQEY